MNYSVKQKIDGKWMTFGNVKVNKFGNPELGIRCTEELKKMVAGAEAGKWLNFSLFEPREDGPPKPIAKPIDDSIPWE